MRLRPGPVVEAMATVALSFLFIFGWFALMPVTGFPQLATYSVLLFLFPIFTVQLIGGLFVRTKPRNFRFLVLAGLAVLPTLGFLMFFGSINPNIVNNGALSIGAAFQGAAIVVLVSILLALAITEYLVISDEKTKLSGSQYTQNPSVSPRSKRKKK